MAPPPTSIFETARNPSVRLRGSRPEKKFAGSSVAREKRTACRVFRLLAGHPPGEDRRGEGDGRTRNPRTGEVFRRTDAAVVYIHWSAGQLQFFRLSRPSSLELRPPRALLLRVRMMVTCVQWQIDTQINARRNARRGPFIQWATVSPRCGAAG